MFKKLRNHMMLVNMIIISSLVLGSFSVIYMLVSHNVKNSVEQRLTRELSFTSNDDKGRQPGNIKPPKNNKPDDKPKDPKDDKNIGIPPYLPDDANHYTSLPGQDNSLTLAFTVSTDSEGVITDTHSQFILFDESYKKIVSDIVQSGVSEGNVSYSDEYWAYKCIPYHAGYAVAFVSCSSERVMTRNLILVLSLVGLAALTLAYLISYYTANKSIKPIEESYNKQKQFVADASHELKTPLTTINTNIDVLLGHGENTIAEEKKWLVYIKDEVNRMTKLTNDLLYLAKSDHNNNILYEKVSFSDAVEGVILTMEAAVFEHNLSFDYDISPDINVYASTEQLKQLTMILLDNAVKYTPKGGYINIALKSDTKNSEAVLRVENSGEGINETDRKNIFERFYRADKSRARKSGGYGLGLAIAKAICESFNGSIKCESVLGSHTAFCVTLPIARD